MGASARHGSVLTICLLGVWERYEMSRIQLWAVQVMHGMLRLVDSGLLEHGRHSGCEYPATSTAMQWDTYSDISPLVLIVDTRV